MKAKRMGDENSVFKPAYEKLLVLISEAEKRYNEKLYIDSITEIARNWTNEKVFLHGDRNIVNMITIKMITWQHNHCQRGCGKIFIYPAEDRELYEKDYQKVN